MTSMDIDSPTTPIMAITPAMPADNDETPLSMEQPNKRRRKKSIVWEHFTIETVGAGCMRACCKQCKKSFAYITGSKLAGTSHLKRHIALGICPVSRQKNEASQFTPGAKSDPPKRRYRTSPGLGSIPFDQNRCNQEVAKMIIQHEYPLHIVEHPAFVDFVRTLQPQYNMASFNTIQGECVALYLKEKQGILDLISRIPGRVNLTLDLRTSNLNVGYVFITGHFIDDDWNLHRRILNVVMLPFPDSDYAFNQAVISCISDWHLENRLFTLTLDQSFSNDNIIGNLRGLLSVKNPLMFNGQLLKGNCYTRVLSCLAQDALGATADVIKRIRESVKYVKTSDTHDEKFTELRQRLQVPSTRDLIIDDQTKWDTTYQMLVAACELKEVFACLDTTDPVYKINPSMDDWKQAEILCTYLKLLYDAASILTGPTYPPANAFYHEVSKIQLELTHAAMSQDPFVSNLAKPLKEKFDQYWRDCFLVLALAIVMDPRFKMKLVEFSFSRIFGEDAGMWIKIVDDGIHELYLDYLTPSLSVPAAFMEAGDAGISQSDIFQEAHPQEATSQEESFQAFQVAHPTDVAPQEVDSQGATIQELQPEEVASEAQHKEDSLHYACPLVVNHQEVAQQEMNTQEVPVQETQSQDLPPQEINNQELPLKAMGSREVPAQEMMDSQEVPAQEMNSQDVPMQEMHATEVPVEEMHTQEGHLEEKNKQEVSPQEMQSKESVPTEGMQAEQSVPTEGIRAGESVPVDWMQAGESVPSEGMQAGESVPVEGMQAGESVPTEGLQAEESVPTEGMQVEESVPTEGMQTQEVQALEKPTQEMQDQEKPTQEMQVEEKPTQERQGEEKPTQEKQGEEKPTKESQGEKPTQESQGGEKPTQEVHVQRELTQQVDAQGKKTEEMHGLEKPTQVPDPQEVPTQVPDPQEVPTQDMHPQEYLNQEMQPQEAQSQEMQPQEAQTQEMQPQEAQTQEMQPQEAQIQEMQPQEAQTQEMHLAEGQTQEMHPPEAHIHEVHPLAAESQGVCSPEAQTQELQMLGHEVHLSEGQAQEMHPPEGATNGMHSQEAQAHGMHSQEAGTHEMQHQEVQTHKMQPQEVESQDSHFQAGHYHESHHQEIPSREMHSHGVQAQEMDYQSLSHGMQAHEIHTQDLPLLSIGDGLQDFEVYISEIASSQHLKSELDQYLEESLLPRVQEFDVLGWWKLNKLKYPTLAKMAADILSIPVSSVAPESVFDTRSKKIDSYWSSLRPVTLEALVCAKDWLQYGSSSSLDISNELVKMEY